MDDGTLRTIVDRLRHQGSDDAAVEVKSAAQELGKAVWDSVSAFANTGGGVVLLGLDETDGFRPVPEFALEKVRDAFVAGMGEGGEQGKKIDPVPGYEIWRGTSQDAPVLVIEIDELPPDAKPCHVVAKGVQRGSYKRLDDKDIRLSPTEIYEMQRVLEPSETDREVVKEADPDDFDAKLVAEFLDRNGRSKALRGVTDPSEALARLSALTKDGKVRLAGLMALGSYPQQFLPRLFIDVTSHPGTDKSSRESLRFLDRVQCDGPLGEAIDAAVQATARNLRTHAVVVGSSRRDELEIPEEVLREAIANAVVHREYAPLFRGQAVSVDVYSDRVEITSPGGLWGGKTPENLSDGVSKCRNQTLMQILQNVPFPSGAGPTAEGQGSGIKLMQHSMHARALDGPRFEITPDQVRVVLRRHGAEVPEQRAWLEDLADRPLTKWEGTALLIARQSGSVTVAVLREVGMDSDHARALLDGLRREGLLRGQGPDRFVLTEGSPVPTPAEMDVLRALSRTEPRSIYDVEASTGRSATSLRPVLRALVRSGAVEATAPPTSTKRRYLRSAE